MFANALASPTARKNLGFTTFFTVAAIVAFAANATASTVLINNLNNSNNTTISGGNILPGHSLAQRFSTTSTGYNLEVVALYLQTSDVDNIGGTVSVSIWDSSGSNLPQSLLGYVAQNQLMGAFFLNKANNTPVLLGNLSVGLSLQPNSDYWVVVSPSGDYDTRSVTLHWSGYSNTSSPDIGFPTWVSPTLGASTTWSSAVSNTSASNYLRMEVTAVPEPSTYAMIATGGVAALAFASQRRRRAGR